MNAEPDEDACPTPRVSEIPTLPSAFVPLGLLCFDPDTEQFFASKPPSEEHLAASGALDDELAGWWVDQRRRAFARWVAGIMALCLALTVLAHLA